MEVIGGVILLLFVVALVIGVVLALTLYGTWAWAIVTQHIWAWFIVPTFGAVPLTFQQAIAVGVIISLIHVKGYDFTKVGSTKDDKDKSDSQVPVAIVLAIVLPWLTMFFAWVTKCFFIN